MSEYHFNEGAFTIPSEGVIDRSMTALEIASDDRRLSVVVTRKPRTEETLGDLATSMRESMTVSLRRFRPEPVQPMDVGGFPAVAFRFRWIHDAGPMFQRVAIIALDDVNLTLTVGGNDDRQAKVDALFESIVTSMKYRRRA